MTALLVIVQYRHEEIIQKLIDHNVDIEYCDVHQNHLLLLAFAGGHQECAMILL